MRIAAACVLLVFASWSRAALILEFSEPGGPTLAITDQFAPDFNPTVGFVQFSNPANVFGIVFGDFTLFSFHGTSNRTIPISTTANLSLSTLSPITIKNTTSAPRTFNVRVGDTGFSVPTVGPLALASSAIGTFSVIPGSTATSVLGSFATIQTFSDAANTQFGTGFVADNFVFTAPDSSAATYTDLDEVFGFNPAGPYSLSIMASFTLAANTQLTLTSNQLIARTAVATGVLEPGTLALVLAALFSMLLTCEGPWRPRRMQR